MSFTLENFTTVHLAHMGVRAELHGTDPVPAVDIKFRLTGSNDLLNMFDTGLKPAFYTRADGGEDEPELDGIDPLSALPKLRTTSINMPIHLSREYIGLNLVLDFGLGGKSNVELFGDADNFRADMSEGGSVDIEFRFKASGIKGPALGKLGELVKHDVRITLMSSAEADGTQERLPGTTKPKVHSGADLLAQTPEDALAHASTPATPKQLRDAERAARFPVAAKKTATKKVVPFKTKAALAARKAAKK